MGLDLLEGGDGEKLGVHRTWECTHTHTNIQTHIQTHTGENGFGLHFSNMTLNTLDSFDPIATSII